MKIQDTQKLLNVRSFISPPRAWVHSLRTGTPGAFNRIELQMVKFSQELSKIVLPLNKFGSHLNSKGETINPELKKKNFMHVTQILAEIWLGIIIDSHPVLAEYINEDVEEEILKKSIDRKRNHI